MSLLRPEKSSIYGLMLLAFLATSCNVQSDSPSDSLVIARVGNSILTYGEAWNEAAPALLTQDTLAALSQVQSGWISEQLLLQNARAIGLDRDPEYLRLQREASEELLRQMMLERLRFGDEADSVSVADAQQYYERHREQFTFGEPFVRIRMLSASSYERAVSARTALLRGEEWESIIRRYSLYPEAQIDMEKRFLPVSLAASDIPALNRSLTAMGIREVSSVYRTNGRWHFAQLLEIRQPSETPDLDWILKMIQDWLVIERRRKDTNTHIRNLYLQAEATGNLFRLESLPIGVIDSGLPASDGQSSSDASFSKENSPMNSDANSLDQGSNGASASSAASGGAGEGRP